MTTKAVSRHSKCSLGKTSLSHALTHTHTPRIEKHSLEINPVSTNFYTYINISIYTDFQKAYISGRFKYCKSNYLHTSNENHALSSRQDSMYTRIIWQHPPCKNVVQLQRPKGKGLVIWPTTTVSLKTEAKIRWGRKVYP